MAPDFPGLWGEVINITAYLKNRISHKYFPSSTIPIACFHRKNPMISYLNLVRKYILCPDLSEKGFLGK
jgi:hypothetical protein